MSVCRHQDPSHSDLPAVTYEREPGSVSMPLPRGYRGREPEKTALYEVVREHLETLLEEARTRSEEGTGYPRFIEHEFRRFLSCCILGRGFARVRCPECGYDRLVAFSCKGRLCPCCWARRTAEIAADLVDRVLPEAPYRQWVLTFPFPLRFLLATDSAFLADMLRAFNRTLFAWQRLRGRRLGLRHGQTGAVTMIQRFGGIANLNPHFHSVLPDGLFVPSPDGPMTFFLLPPPTDHDIQDLTTRLAKRLGDIARKRFEQVQDQPPWPDDQTHVHAALADSPRLPRSEKPDDKDQTRHDEEKHLCARVDGFSLHAGRTVEASDREGLERLLRYGLRAPFSNDRLSLVPDGHVRLRLLRPWPKPGGRTEVVFEPLQFMKRLVALIPRPYGNLVRYHGVFANRSKFRPWLPKPPPRVPLNVSAPCDCASPEASTEASNQTRGLQSSPPAEPLLTKPPRRHRSTWAQMLRRVLDVDALKCPRCSTPMIVIAFLTDPSVVRKILDHLHLPVDPPPLGPTRCPDTDPFLPDVEEDPPKNPDHTRPTPRFRPSRAPP